MIKILSFRWEEPNVNVISSLKHIKNILADEKRAYN